jgi:N-carbamoylputrescine amidase
MAVRTPQCQVGPLVCWDQWYPEAARLTAMKGAEVLFYPTAIGWLPEEKAEYGKDQLEAWQTIQRAHAIANGVFTVSVNRVGIETSPAGSIEFWGHSFVCAPSGKVLAEAGSEPQVLVVECDLQQIADTRRIWPFFRDRRVDAYADLTKRWSE